MRIFVTGQRGLCVCVSIFEYINIVISHIYTYVCERTRDGFIKKREQSECEYVCVHRKDNQATTRTDPSSPSFPRASLSLSLSELFLSSPILHPSPSTLYPPPSTLTRSGTTRKNFPGYEEVYIPPVIQDTASLSKADLVPVSGLSEIAQAAFKGVKLLNRLQTTCFHAAYRTSSNLVSRVCVRAVCSLFAVCLCEFSLLSARPCLCCLSTCLFFSLFLSFSLSISLVFSFLFPFYVTVTIMQPLPVVVICSALLLVLVLWRRITRVVLLQYPFSSSCGLPFFCFIVLFCFLFLPPFFPAPIRGLGSECQMRKISATSSGSGIFFH